MNIQEHQNGQKPDMVSVRDMGHYQHLFKRSKWYLLISGPLVFVMILIVVFFIRQPKNPELAVSTLVGLEQISVNSANNERTVSNLGCEDIMMSRRFLMDVVQKASLQVWTIPFNRSDFFDSVSMDASAAGGTYCVHFISRKSGNFQITYYDTSAIKLPLVGFLPTCRRKIVARGFADFGKPVQLPGISFKFSRQITKKPYDFSFQIVDSRVAVEAVFRNLTIKRANPDEGINHITVSLSGRDYELSAVTVNTIVDVFIEKISGIRQQHIHSLVESLEKQLSISQSNLGVAELKMRKFRSKNPQAGLNQQILQVTTALAQLNSDIQNITNDANTAKHLKKNFSNADSAKRLQIAEEMAGFLSARGVPAGGTLQEELSRLIAQKYTLLASYGPENPKILENKRQTVNMTWQTHVAISDFINNSNLTISRKRDSIQHLSDNLPGLPALEMKYGEFERNRQIYADIYSAILAEYNKAKVTEAVEKSGFYIMDYAVAPLPPPVAPVPMVIISLLIAVMLSFGPVLIYDIFDKSAHSQRQLANITRHTILETIPVFTVAGSWGIFHKPNVYPLISMSCKPIFIKEIFDTLHLKINLLMNESIEHGIVVSSFESKCGKSIISSNLAMAIAMCGHKTLLVDADLRRGMVNKIFNHPDSEGLSELLARPDPLGEEDCARSIITTEFTNLYILPSGRKSQNPGVLLSSQRMEEFRKFCENRNFFLVMDSSPIGAVTDTIALQKLFAHYIFVVRAGKTNVSKLIDRISEFGNFRNKILGYVLNAVPCSEVGDYRHYFRTGLKDFFVDNSTKKSA